MSVLTRKEAAVVKAAIATMVAFERKYERISEQTPEYMVALAEVMDAAGKAVDVFKAVAKRL